MGNDDQGLAARFAVIFNDIDRAAAVSGRNSGRFLTIIYPDEFRDWLFGTEAVTAFPAGQDLIRELGFAISKASSVVFVIPTTSRVPPAALGSSP